MMKKFVKSKVIDEKGLGYGLSITLPSGDVREYRMLFTVSSEAERLSERINRLEVSEHHISDIIEDALHRIK